MNLERRKRATVVFNLTAAAAEARSTEAPASRTNGTLPIGELGNLGYTLVDPDQCSPSERDMKSRESVVLLLQDFLRRSIPDITLKMYGSSCNGFCTRESDIDICLTISNGEHHLYQQHFNTVVRELRRFKALRNVKPRPWGKVHLITFTYHPRGFLCDLSFRNTLAYHNSKLLKAYSEIDPRVRVLGYTMKHFAKNIHHDKGLADAATGGLASYGFILLVVYYLQQCEPPVLPVLQELYPKGREKPRRDAEGWNVWFFERIDRLGTVWTGYNKNQQPADDLWEGMLEFYTSTFQYRDNVVSIRQRAPLTKRDKAWHGKFLAIEDPFDLNRDLCKGLNERKWKGIIYAFSTGKREFRRSASAQQPQQAADASMPATGCQEPSSDQQPANRMPFSEQSDWCSRSRASGKLDQPMVPHAGHELQSQPPRQPIWRGGRGRASQRRPVGIRAVDECRRPGLQDLSLGPQMPSSGSAPIGAYQGHSLGARRGRARGRPLDHSEYVPHSGS